MAAAPDPSARSASSSKEPASPSSMDFNQTLLGLGDDPAEFDYGVFFQDDEAEYLAEESSNSTSTNVFTDISAQTVTPHGPMSLMRADSGPSMSTGSPPKQRLERRGHTKSRRGCFNCKRRRIKVWTVTQSRTPLPTFWVELRIDTWNSARRPDRHVAIAQSRDSSASILPYLR